jgi:tripartite-type tricarboxylate transporter receptor subunit TctC
VNIGRRSVQVIAAAMAAVLVHGTCAAQDSSAHAFPSKPIRIIIGFTPGGAPDITARILGQKLMERWKQQVIVENRPGAGSTIAAQYVATSPPDGHTLFSVTSSLAVAPAIYAKLPYDTFKDLAGVTMTSNAPTWVLVPPSLGVKTARDLIALAKAKPGQLNYASAGVGSFMHFSAELFKIAAGIDALHIPFKGVPEALTETVTGRVDFVVAPIGAAVNLVGDGKLLALGVTGKQRLTRFPAVPVLAESGMPGFYLNTWTGLVAPGQTPRPILEKISREVASILREPDVQARWAGLGVESVPTTPEEFDKVIAEDAAAFTKAARAANIKAN